MNDLLRAVADDLHFDMTSVRHHLLEVEVAVAKGRARLGLATLVGRRDLLDMMYGAYAPAAAAGDGLDHHRSAVERPKKLSGLLEARGSRRSGQHRHPAVLRQ